MRVCYLPLMGRSALSAGWGGLSTDSMSVVATSRPNRPIAGAIGHPPLRRGGRRKFNDPSPHARVRDLPSMGRSARRAGWGDLSTE